MMTFKMETVVHPPVKLNLAFIVMENLLFLYVFLYLHSTIVEMASLNLKKNVMITIKILTTDAVLNVSLKQDSIVMKMEFVRPNVETA